MAYDFTPEDIPGPNGGAPPRTDFGGLCRVVSGSEALPGQVNSGQFGSILTGLTRHLWVQVKIPPL